MKRGRCGACGKLETSEMMGANSWEHFQEVSKALFGARACWGEEAVNRNERDGGWRREAGEQSSCIQFSGV